MNTIMIIAIYADGSRLITETPAVKSSREWRAAMKQVGKSICRAKMPVKALVIDRTDVAEYNLSEVEEIFGV